MPIHDCNEMVSSHTNHPIDTDHSNSTYSNGATTYGLPNL